MILGIFILLAPFLFFAWIDRAGGVNGPGK
jgi:hypothetical protein